MSKVNQTGDVQSLNTFGLAYAINNAFSQSTKLTANAVSGTSITSSVATGQNDDSIGCMIIANSSSAWATTAYYGVCQDNTTTVYTVDKWYTMTGATGANPSSTSPFVVLPCSAPFWFVAISTSTAAVTGTETGAAMGGTEHSTNGLGRQKITSVARTAGTAITYDIVCSTTFTFTGSTSTNIGRSMLTNSSVLNKDFAYFIDQVDGGTPAVVAVNGDTATIQYTITVG